MVEKTIEQTSGNETVEQQTLQLALGDRPQPGVGFTMTVKGDCMEPEVRMNDVIFCVPCPVPDDGDMVVIHTASGFQLRRYVLEDGCIPFLVPNNKNYRTTKLGPQHEICGKVVDIRRKG